MSSREEIRRTIGNERLVNLLREVDRKLAETDKDHFADDELLVEKWAAGSLTDDEYEAVLKHLAACDECSQFLHDMTQAGIFGNAAAESDVSNQTDSLQKRNSNLEKKAGLSMIVDRPSEVPSFSRPRRQSGLVVTTAACALIAFVGYIVTQTSDLPDNSLLLGKAEFGQVTHYLSEAQFGSIVSANGKGPNVPDIILPDVRRDRELVRLAGLVDRYPKNATHKLNLGQVLLEAGQFEAAHTQFQAATALEPENPYALLGRGIAEFRRGELELAEQSFAAVADDVSAGVSARVNRVLTLIALDRMDEACELWKTVPTEDQAEKISNVLQVDIPESNEAL
jgi:hypothetical protein